MKRFVLAALMAFPASAAAMPYLNGPGTYYSRPSSYPSYPVLPRVGEPSYSRPSYLPGYSQPSYSPSYSRPSYGNTYGR